jgi:hypothetical protein
MRATVASETAKPWRRISGPSFGVPLHRMVECDQGRRPRLGPHPPGPPGAERALPLQVIQVARGAPTAWAACPLVSPSAIACRQRATAA